MPQLDLVETQHPPLPEYPHLPAESHVLKIGDEIGWVDLNAVYDRDDSTKGNTNPKALHASHGKPRSNSQRFSGNLTPKAPPIIGLPGTIQHSGYLSRSARRPTNARIFPKKPCSQGSKKSAVPDDEPVSPKVSCIGKVLSERERERFRKECKEKKKNKNKNRAEEGEVVTAGCWAGFAAAFCCGGGVKRVECAVDKIPASSPVKAKAKAGKRASPEKGEVEPGPPGLGVMNRFASGRKAATWCEDASLC